MDHQTERPKLQLLRLREVAQRLSMSLASVKVLIQRGELPSILITPRSRRVAVADLEAFLERRRAES